MDTRSPKLNAQIYGEACEWFVDLRDRAPSDATRREFDRWLRLSPEHLSAYLEIAAIWSEAPSLDPGQKWTRNRLIDEATAGAGNVVPFIAGEVQAPANVTDGDGRPRRMRVAASLAAALIIAGAGVFVLLDSSRVMSYDTAIGEQRSVALPDGSMVELNARSRVEIRYSDRSRDIELLEGQALFNVARDPARPFVVTSGNTRVRAVGTQFDVYKKQGGTVVTVVEGRVVIGGSLAAGRAPRQPLAVGELRVPVSPEDGEVLRRTGSAEILLTAGSQVVVTDATIQKPVRPNVTGAIAWRQRRLIFESASLVEVAEEFNRYNTRQLVIQDPTLHAFNISGVFSSTDPASLIRFLRERPEVQVIETPTEIRVTKNTR